MGQTYHRTKLIRFAHCDAAGIVFYPRYAELCHELVEDWFREALGTDLYTLHEVQGFAFPTVKLHIEYLRPSRYGETLDFALQVRHLGSSSVTLHLVARRGHEERVRIDLKLVHVDYQTLRPTPVGEPLRSQLTRFLVAPAQKAEAS